MRTLVTKRAAACAAVLLLILTSLLVPVSAAAVDEPDDSSVIEYVTEPFIQLITGAGRALVNGFNSFFVSGSGGVSTEGLYVFVFVGVVFVINLLLLFVGRRRKKI